MIACLGLLCASAASSPSRPNDPWERPGQLVRLADGRRINLRCSGHGTPTVVLDSGYAATSAAWEKVQPVIAATTRVCSYDRAGYGFSDPGPFPRDGQAVARDLDEALRRAGIQGPFVLVGHSAGGLYARLFADRRWSDVAGMVFADTSVEFQDQRLAAVVGKGAGSVAGLRRMAAECLDALLKRRLPSQGEDLKSCTPTATNAPAAAQTPLVQRQLQPAYWRTRISELDTLWTATSSEVASGRQSYGDLPLIALTADGTYSEVPEPYRSRLAALWSQLHNEVATRSRRGKVRLVEHSSHMMVFDRPDAINAAIIEVVTVARTSPSKAVRR